MTVKRIWHGWTSPENAATYETLLKTEVFAGIEGKNIPGYQGIQLLRMDHADEVEFITIMTFDDISNVIAFQGQDYTRCYVPDAAQKVLSRWNSHSDHFEVRETRTYL